MNNAPHICFTFVGDVTRDSRLRRFRQSAAELGEVSLVTLTPPGQPAGTDAAETELQKLHHMLSAAETQQSSRFFRVESDGKETRFHPPDTASLRMSLPRFWREGARVAEQSGADMFFASDLYSLPVATSAARRTGRPLIYDARELYRSVAALTQRPVTQRFWRSLEQRYARNAAAILTVNESIADLLREKYPSVYVIRNLPDWKVDRATDLLRRHIGIEDGRVLLLSQGGLQKGRGATMLVDALPRLPECDLVFLGDGSLREEIRSRAEEFSVAGRVHFAGSVPSSELPRWTASADIGMCVIENLGTSYYLSLPNKLFEYIAAGVPVIGSDFPEIGAVLRESGAGIPITPDSGASIAQAVRQLIDDPVRMKNLRAHCFAAADAYQWKREEERFRTILADILSTIP